MAKQNRFLTLDLQLSAIQDVLAAAQRRSSPERRTELLLLVERALLAYHEEHKALLARRGFQLLKGGAIIAALALPPAWLRDAWRGHQGIAVGTAAAPPPPA